MDAPSEPRPTVSGRWLLAAIGVAFAGALLCCWGTLCLLFWQGSWQLLYHPSSALARTPASVGVAFDPVGFGADDSGRTQLTGWWIPAGAGAHLSQITVLYLHSQNGNLSDTVDALAALHAAGVNVLAFDYRGYGQSQFAHPSEAHWREDAETAIAYLSGTRHIAAGSILLDGEGLGANLALEIGAAHPELAGVILREPLQDPTRAMFEDGRARLVPARLLVRDRYDLNAPAVALRLPLLWIAKSAFPAGGHADPQPAVFEKVQSRKEIFWFAPGQAAEEKVSTAVAQWLADLAPRP